MVIEPEDDDDEEEPEDEDEPEDDDDEDEPEDEPDDGDDDVQVRVNFDCTEIHPFLASCGECNCNHKGSHLSHLFVYGNMFCEGTAHIEK